MTNLNGMTRRTVSHSLLVAVLLIFNLFAEGETKMTMLNWGGKQEVVNHYNDVPCRILEKSGMC